MGLTKYRLGDLISLSEKKNADSVYQMEDLRGISIQKIFIPTKADMEGVSLKPYLVVEKNSFAYVPTTSRNGDKITIAFNQTDKTYIVSSSYVVFTIKYTDVLQPEYLFMLFNRPEFDRYSRFHSWGSARETFSWDEMCDLEVNLPDVEIQQKYINIYTAMLRNQLAYEQGLEDLKLTCEAITEEIKYDAVRRPLGELIVECDTRNTDNSISTVQGVNKEKQFMPSVASGADLSKYKLVLENQFACNLMHVGRDVAVPIALNANECPMMVSPAYIVFKLKDASILPSYVMMWLTRTETDRCAWFMSDTSVRSGMEKKRFYELSIPIPDIKIQQYIVNIYIAYQLRREINEQLKAQMKDICPILVKGALEEGAKS